MFDGRPIRQGTYLAWIVIQYFAPRFPYFWYSLSFLFLCVYNYLFYQNPIPEFSFYYQQLLLIQLNSDLLIIIGRSPSVVCLLRYSANARTQGCFIILAIKTIGLNKRSSFYTICLHRFTLHTYTRMYLPVNVIKKKQTAKNNKTDQISLEGHRT